MNLSCNRVWNLYVHGATAKLLQLVLRKIILIPHACAYTAVHAGSETEQGRARGAHAHRIGHSTSVMYYTKVSNFIPLGPLLSPCGPTPVGLGFTEIPKGGWVTKGQGSPLEGIKIPS